jgi:hypothetical protein
MVGLLAASQVTAQGGSPCATGIVQPLLPPVLLPEWQAHVDPTAGDDLLGTVYQWATPNARAFRTIQAALDAVAVRCSVTGPVGVVHLLPGRYGFDAQDPKINGERWPVLLRPHVSLRGADAMRVILDGSALAPNSPQFTVASQLGAAPLTPVLLAATLPGESYERVAVSRVTIWQAQIGLMVDGAGAGNLTLAESLIAFGSVGALLRSPPQGLGGVHRTRFLWCTFGSNTVGLASTGMAPAGQWAAPASQPAIVNSVFKNLLDLEGISCDAVVASAFGGARCNLLFPLPPGVVAPTPLVELSAYSEADLFLGARQPVAPGPYSDWRLTHGTLTSGLPNPLRTGGVTGLPISTPNGTPVTAQFGAHLLGLDSAEGPGTFGPMGPPLGPAGPSHLGYRSGGTFLVGGTIPKTRRFGPSAQGIMYDTMHLITPGGSSTILLFAVASTGSAWNPILGQPTGMAAVPTAPPPSPLPGLLLGGEWFLEPSLTLINLTSFAQQSSASAYENRVSLPLNLPPWITGQVHMLLQAMTLEGNTVVAGDAQAITIGA